jgi:hypothetical protein
MKGTNHFIIKLSLLGVQEMDKNISFKSGNVNEEVMNVFSFFIFYNVSSFPIFLDIKNIENYEIQL